MVVSDVKNSVEVGRVRRDVSAGQARPPALHYHWVDTGLQQRAWLETPCREWEWDGDSKLTFNIGKG